MADTSSIPGNGTHVKNKEQFVIRHFDKPQEKGTDTGESYSTQAQNQRSHPSDEYGSSESDIGWVRYHARLRTTLTYPEWHRFTRFLINSATGETVMIGRIAGKYHTEVRSTLTVLTATTSMILTMEHANQCQNMSKCVIIY